MKHLNLLTPKFDARDLAPGWWRSQQERQALDALDRATAILERASAYLCIDPPDQDTREALDIINAAWLQVQRDYRRALA